MQSTVLCNLSHVLTKSNFVLQRVATEKVSLNTAQAVKGKIRRFATCRRFLQKATLFCNVQKRCFCLPCPKFCFLNLHPLFFLATCFSRHCAEILEKILQCRLLWRGQVPTSPRVLCNNRKGAKAFVSTCKFFQGAVSAPFCFAKNCLLFCEICFLFCQICRCVSKQRS